MRIKMLEDQLHTAHQQIEDLREQRDRWQRQADQVLLTSQHSQKQADELREELKRREVAERLRRQKLLEERMQRLKAQNENSTKLAEKQRAVKQAAENQATRTAKEVFSFQGLWKKAKGQ